jgi:hypothetical protein
MQKFGPRIGPRGPERSSREPASPGLPGVSRIEETGFQTATARPQPGAAPSHHASPVGSRDARRPAAQTQTQHRDARATHARPSHLLNAAAVLQAILRHRHPQYAWLVECGSQIGWIPSGSPCRRRHRAARTRRRRAPAPGRRAAYGIRDRRREPRSRLAAGRVAACCARRRRACASPRPRPARRRAPARRPPGPAARPAPARAGRGADARRRRTPRPRSRARWTAST